MSEDTRDQVMTKEHAQLSLLLDAIYKLRWVYPDDLKAYTNACAAVAEAAGCERPKAKKK